MMATKTVTVLNFALSAYCKYTERNLRLHTQTASCKALMLSTRGRAASACRSIPLDIFTAPESLASP